MIETSRLILRPMRVDDASDLLEYQSNPEIVRYIPWPEGNAETVKKHIERTLADSKDLPLDEGDYLVLVWELKDSGKVIGQSNISMQSKEHLRGEVGWVTHQDYQRQGFAFEASNAGFRPQRLWRRNWACAKKPNSKKLSFSRVNGVTCGFTQSSNQNSKQDAKPPH